MTSPTRLGRYELFDEIARGGTAAVHLGRIAGAAGFTKVVAVKRVFPMLSGDPEFVAMFRDEVRLATRVRHANVIAPLDVDMQGDDLFLVMDYVEGDSLSRLIRAAGEKKEPIPVKIALRIMIDVLEGLQAAHSAKDENGQPLGIVHRDISPHNILVGTDGTARVVDFGIAKATVRASTTREGHIKGKLGYMAAEQLSGENEDARTDVYGASVVLWEMLTSERLFHATNEGNLLARVLEGMITPPERIRRDLPEALSQAVLRGLQRDPSNRFQSAREMAVHLESIATPAAAREVGEWVVHLGGEDLRKRRERIDEIERGVTSAVESSPSNEEKTVTASISSPSQSTEGEVPATTRWRAVAFAIGAIVLLGIGGAFALTRNSPPSPTQPSPVEPSLAPPPSPGAPLLLDSSAPIFEAERSGEDANAPSTRTLSDAGRTPIVPRSSKCATPTFIDSRGIRRIKPGCL